MENEARVYDAKHPWISGPHEDPSKANWFSEFFNPAGRAPQPIFLRGQSLLALVRVFVIVAGFAALSASPWVGAGILFVGLLLLLFMSIVSHVRRLQDSGRSPLFALILVIPLLLASGLTVPDLAKIPQKVEAAQEAARKAKERVLAAKPTPTEDTKVSEGGDETAKADTASTDEAKAQPAQRRGRRGPPMQVTTESMLGQKIGEAVQMYLLLSFFTMLFSLIFVARGKSVSRDHNPLVS